MNRISLARLKLALLYRLAIEASPAGGWLYSKGWAMAAARKLPELGAP